MVDRPTYSHVEEHILVVIPTELPPHRKSLVRNSNFSGMRRHVTLEDEEFPAIAVAMPLHVLVGDCASFCVGRTSFEEVAGGYSVISRLGATVAERVRRQFHA